MIPEKIKKIPQKNSTKKSHKKKREKKYENILKCEKTMECIRLIGAHELAHGLVRQLKCSWTIAGL